MDRRIPLVVSSIAGLALGAAVMVWSVPDTSGDGPVLPAASAPPLAAAPDGQPAVAPADPFAAAVAAAGDDTDVPVNPFAPAGQDANPFGAAPADPDDPFAALGAWGEPEPEDAPAADPAPEAIGSRGAAEVGGGAAVAGATAGLPPDVRGVSQAMQQLNAPIRACMERDAPAKNPGETRVMVQVHISAQGDAGKVTAVTAPRDTENRYTALLGCVTSAMSAVTFLPPGSGTVMINWSLNR